MCIPAPGKSEAGFKTLNKLAEECGTLTRGELSMGMSDDYLLAIQNGATSIRIGTALFGKRN
jgi:uncharacterized pyridoxal phosphate-containing UPF0001 family protein